MYHFRRNQKFVCDLSHMLLLKPYTVLANVLITFILTVRCRRRRSSGSKNLLVRSDLLHRQLYPYAGDYVFPMETPKPDSGDGPIPVNSTPNNNQPATASGGAQCFIRERMNGFCALMKDGFSFYRDRKDGTNVLWRCARRFSKCGAKIREIDNKFHIINGEHSAACRKQKKTKCIGTMHHVKKQIV